VIRHDAASESQNPALRTELCCHQHESLQRCPVRCFHDAERTPPSRRLRNPSPQSGNNTTPDIATADWLSAICLLISWYKSSKFPGSHVFFHYPFHPVRSSANRIAKPKCRFARISDNLSVSNSQGKRKGKPQWRSLLVFLFLHVQATFIVHSNTLGCTAIPCNNRASRSLLRGRQNRQTPRCHPRRT
jgi:hypothetical protein